MGTAWDILCPILETVTMCPCKLQSPWCPLQCPGTPSLESSEDSQAMVFTATTLISVLPREPHLFVTEKLHSGGSFLDCGPMTSPPAQKCSKQAHGWTACVFHCDLLTSRWSLAVGQPPLLLSGQSFFLMMFQAPVFNMGPRGQLFLW